MCNGKRRRRCAHTQLGLVSRLIRHTQNNTLRHMGVNGSSEVHRKFHTVRLNQVKAAAIQHAATRAMWARQDRQSSQHCVPDAARRRRKDPAALLLPPRATQFTANLHRTAPPRFVRHSAEHTSKRMPQPKKGQPHFYHHHPRVPSAYETNRIKITTPLPSCSCHNFCPSSPIFSQSPSLDVGVLRGKLCFVRQNDVVHVPVRLRSV